MAPDSAGLQVLSWSMELARALCFLHNCNPVIIHRDLKPANLLSTRTATSRSFQSRNPKPETCCRGGRPALTARLAGPVLPLEACLEHLPACLEHLPSGALGHPRTCPTCRLTARAMCAQVGDFGLSKVKAIQKIAGECCECGLEVI